MSLDVQLAPTVTAAQGTGGQSPSSSVSTATVSPEQRATTGSPAPQKGHGDGASSHEQLVATVSKLNQQTQKLQRDLQFVVDRQSGAVVVQVIDTQSKHVIRQIPSKDIMALRHELDKLSSLLFHTKA